MYVNLKLFLLPCLLLSFTPLSATEFNQVFGIDAGNSTSLANLLTTARHDQSLLSMPQHYQYLLDLHSRIEKNKSSHSEDPMAWFLYGLSLNTLAETRYLMLIETGDNNIASDDREINELNIARTRAYDNAIRLDGDEPHQLSAEIYANMGYGLSNRQKIKTYSREIKQGTAGASLSSEVFLHWAKIESLVHEKKLDEARTAIDDLTQLLEQKSLSDSPYQTVVAQATTQVNQSVEQKILRARASAQSNAKQAFKNTITAWSWKTWLLFLIGTFSFLFVLMTSIYYQFQKRTDSEDMIQ
jgi:hypothetical protein